MVNRMLVGEPNSRVRRNPAKPVVLIGAVALRHQLLADEGGSSSRVHPLSSCPRLRLIRQS